MKLHKNLVSEITGEIKSLLATQSLSNQEPINTEQACRFMGIKKSYLYQLTHRKEIPFYKPNGKMIYFAKNDLLEWIFKNRHKSRQEIQNESENILNKMGGINV